MSLINDFRQIYAIGDLFSRITTIPTLKVCHIFLEKQDEAANTFHANIFSFCLMVSRSFVKGLNCISALIYPWSLPKPFSVYTSHLSVFLMIMHARISFHVPAYLNQQPEDLDDDNKSHLEDEAQF